MEHSKKGCLHCSAVSLNAGRTSHIGTMVSSTQKHKPLLLFCLGLLLLLVVLPLSGCGSTAPGEKLALAPGAQIIGDDENGGAIDRMVSGVMQIVDPDELSDFQAGIGYTSLQERSVPTDFGEVGPDSEYEPENGLSESEVRPHLSKARQWSFGDFTLYLWRGQDFEDEGFALFHRGTLADARKGHFYVASLTAEDKDHLTIPGPAPGADFDGNGVPDLLIYEYSGGAHCCYTVRHIECGQRPLLRCELYTADSRPVFEDMDGDGHPEVRFVDTSYAYWNECFVSSPFPLIVLRIREGRYVFAEEIMRAQGPSEDNVLEERRKQRKWIACINGIDAPGGRGDPTPDDVDIQRIDPVQAWRKNHVCIPSPVWRMMLDQLYSGRSQEALDFVEGVWPESKPGKDEFIREIEDLVLSSWFGRRLPWIGDFKGAVDRALSQS